MALQRFRVARYPDRYVVLDHGAPDADGVYRQDGDPVDPATVTSIVFEAPYTPDGKAEAVGFAGAANTRVAAAAAASNGKRGRR